MSIVKLIALSTPTIEGCNTAEELIAFCARVSNPGNQNNHNTAKKLLAYLQKHKHWSPFEMVSMTVEIITTRDIARQILRHRSFSFQEFSQRYAVTEDEPMFREVRTQDEKNRQSSHETEDVELSAWWVWQQDHIARITREVYNEALQKGIAKEVARAVLPEGLTMSRLYMAGNIRSFLHYCEVRTEAGTQKEHRKIALAIQDLLLSNFTSLSG